MEFWIMTKHVDGERGSARVYWRIRRCGRRRAGKAQKGEFFRGTKPLSNL